MAVEEVEKAVVASLKGNPLCMYLSKFDSTASHRLQNYLSTGSTGSAFSVNGRGVVLIQLMVWMCGDSAAVPLPPV